MELSQFTDYSLRVLLYVGLEKDRLASVKEISEAYGISFNHLVKVSHNLSSKGFLKSYKGKGGGIKLGRPAGQITVGEVIRATENMKLLECFPPKTKTGGCCIAGVCQLQSVLHKALHRFLTELDSITLESLLIPHSEMRKRLKIK